MSRALEVGKKMPLIKLVFGVTLAVALLGASSTHADRGVGISVSRIHVAEDLSRGGGYNLPTFAVINTGDESAEYEVTITHLANQTQHRPDSGWFEFHPRRFPLEPGELRNVSIRLVVPSGADTGDYYAQVQAQVLTDGAGSQVGVAAAARLTFTVEPSSWFAAQRLRISRFLRDIEPWSYVVEGVLIAGLAVFLVTRYTPYRPRLPFERKR